jgi:hypothetical protein
LVSTVWVHAIEGSIQDGVGVSFYEGDAVGRIESPFTTQSSSVDADGDVPKFSVALVWMMAGSAGNILVSRENRIKEKEPAKCDFFLCDRVVGRGLYCSGQSRENLEGKLFLGLRGLGVAAGQTEEAGKKADRFPEQKHEPLLVRRKFRLMYR